MSDFEDRNAGVTETDIEVDRDVVIVEGPKEVRQKRNPLAVLPLLLGVLFLLANVLIFLRVPTVFTTKNVYGAMSLILILASVVTCLSLILYGLASRREVDEASSEERSRSRRSVGVSLLLGLLAPMLTLWGLHVYRIADERYSQTFGKPCIEAYEKAANIAKDNPRFRMPAGDPYEVRCGVNAVLGR